MTAAPPSGRSSEVSVLSTGLKLARRLGVDRAVGYHLLGVGWNLASRPVNLLLTVRFLSAEEQGFFYVFGSVLAVQVFFELGFGVVVQQFASHEAGKLTAAGGGGPVAGDPAAKARLAALFRKSVGWYAGIAGLTAAAILPGGWAFLAAAPAGGPPVAWQPAWVATVLASAGGLLLTPPTMVLSGLGQVAATARVGVAVAVGSTLATWAMLAAGAGLLAAPLAAALGHLATAGWLAARRRALLADLWAHRSAHPPVSWRREMWPFQWRIAVSWLSGYFIFHLFTPVALQFAGPAAAGRVGLTLALVGLLQSAGLLWVTTKMPAFGGLIARREFAALDALFFRALWRSLGLVAAGAAALAAGAAALDAAGSRYADRLLPPGLVLVAALNAPVQHVINALASYLRAHREEPLLVVSVVGGVAAGCSTYFLGRWAGAAGMLAGFLALNALIGLPWVVAIFAAKRRLWHREPAG